MNARTVTATLAAAIGLATLAPAEPAHADGKPERCYGVAAKGQNDCATPQYACVGRSTVDRDPNAWIMVPAGLCERIAGGKLTPGG